MSLRQALTAWLAFQIEVLLNRSRTRIGKIDERLELLDLPDPTPGEGDVVVRVGRCGICGSDLHARHHCDELAEVIDERAELQREDAIENALITTGRPIKDAKNGITTPRIDAKAALDSVR